jgi:hypothetical protein
MTERTRTVRASGAPKQWQPLRRQRGRPGDQDPMLPARQCVLDQREREERLAGARPVSQQDTSSPVEGDSRRPNGTLLVL